VVEFEFCVIFVCYVLSISIEVKFSVSDFDGYEHWGSQYFYACYGIVGGGGRAKKAHAMERNTNASERGYSEDASLWGDWIRISNTRSLRSWCIKGTDESMI